MPESDQHDDITGVEKIDILLDEIHEEDGDDDGSIPCVELQTGIMFPLDPESGKYAAVVHQIEPKSVYRYKNEEGEHVIRIDIALTAKQIKDMYLASTGGVRTQAKQPAITLPPGVSAEGL